MCRLLFLLCVLTFPLTAQAYAPDLASLANVPLISVNVSTVKAAAAAAKNDPLQFAVGVDLSADEASGSWDEPEAGIARWRLRVQSADASSLSLAFENLQLPQDAELYVYGGDGDDVQGPYSAANNGRFWSPLVRNATAVVEARMPVGERSAFSLSVSRAFHAYRDIGGKSFPYDYNSGSPVGNGASGACESDVRCDVGDAWPNEIRAAVLITIADGRSAYLCSGALVNNTAQDDRALILTANHCGITAQNVRSTYAYFNVERAGCGLGRYGPVNQNIAGKALVAATRGTTVTDYALIELASVPPANYNVYYAGWDIGGTPPRTGATIHHPAGDDKKISTFATPASASSSLPVTGGVSDFRIDAWSVSWSQGTTEEGSSGSALLDQSHRIVGTLSGGSGGCSIDDAKQNNGKVDHFARLDRAWTAASATGTTLKAALDPRNKGYSYLNGKDAGAGPSSGGSATGGATTGSSSSDDSGENGGGGFDLCLLPLLLAGLGRRLASRRACRA